MCALTSRDEPGGRLATDAADRRVVRRRTRPRPDLPRPHRSGGGDHRGQRHRGRYRRGDHRRRGQHDDRRPRRLDDDPNPPSTTMRHVRPRGPPARPPGSLPRREASTPAASTRGHRRDLDRRHRGRRQSTGNVCSCPPVTRPSSSSRSRRPAATAPCPGRRPHAEVRGRLGRNEGLRRRTRSSPARSTWSPTGWSSRASGCASSYRRALPLRGRDGGRRPRPTQRHEDGHERTNRAVTVVPGRYATAVTIDNPIEVHGGGSRSRFAPLVVKGKTIGREPDAQPARPFAKLELPRGTRRRWTTAAPARGRRPRPGAAARGPRHRVRPPARGACRAHRRRWGPHDGRPVDHHAGGRRPPSSLSDPRAA